MQDIRLSRVSMSHVLVTIFVVFVGNAVCQYFDPTMDDKTYLDNIQNLIKVEVNETKSELLIQAKIVDNAAKRFVAAQIKENLFIALRVIAERELRELNGYKPQLKITPAKKPKQDEGGGGGGDDDDDGEDGAAAAGGTTRRPNNIIPQVANLVKAVFGGNGNINLTSYVESASKLLPRPIGNQVLGFVKILAHNPREQWTTTPSTKELTTATAPTTLASATTPQQPFIVVLPASAAGGSDNGAAAINQALSEGLVPVNVNGQYNSLNAISQLQGINGTSLANAQSTIVNFETSSFPPISSNQQILANLNNGFNLNLNAQQQQQQQQQIQYQQLIDQNQQFINQAQLQQQQQNPIQTAGVGVPLGATLGAPPVGVPAGGLGQASGTVASSSFNPNSTGVPPLPVSPGTEEDDDDDDEDQDARQLNGLGFLTTLIGGRPSTQRPVASSMLNSTAVAGNGTRAPEEIDLREVAVSVRNGLGDLIKVMPDLFKGAREGFRLIQTISQVFGGLGSLAGDIGRE